GYDCAGLIDAVGDGVQTLSVGQRVAAVPMRGGHAQYAYARPDQVVRVPESIADMATVAATSLNYVSAHQMLQRLAHAQEGQHILVHGAAGGVGTAFLQLATLNHVTVYGTASEAKQDVVTQWGGIPINYQKEDFVARVRALTGGKGVDAVFDPIGGQHLW